MKIRVQDLAVRKLEFALQLQPGDVDFGAEVRQQGVLSTEGRAELLREHHGSHSVDDIRLVGKLEGSVEVSCARCLEPVAIPVSRSFDLLYRPLERGRHADEVAIHEADTEIGYYSGEEMELDEALREQVLLAVPIKSLCRPDCKGLCPVCGGNRNQQPCECEQHVPDARWSALDAWKNERQ